MDLFQELARQNARRELDTPEEAMVLESMRTSANRFGSVSDLGRRLPGLTRAQLIQTLYLLAARRKIEILSGNRWRLR